MKKRLLTIFAVTALMSLAGCTNTVPTSDNPEGQVTEATLSSIAVTEQKTNYEVGDTFVKPTVVAVYSDQNTKIVTEQTTFTGFDSSVAVASQTITASYTEKSVTKTATYTVTISQKGAQEVTLVSISVNNPKSEYQVGDEFVKPTVTARYSDQSTKNVTNSTVFSGFNSSTAAATQAIVASYTEKNVTKTATFYVSIVKKDDPVVGDKVISFNTANRDSSYPLTSMSGVYESGQTLVNSAEPTNVYKGTKGLKFGSSSKKGSLVLNLSSSMAITSIVAKIYLYNTSEPQFTINNRSVTVDKDGDYTYNFDGSEVTKIDIKSTTLARFYIKSLTINVGVVTPVEATAVTIAPAVELAAGGSTTLVVTYEPSDANTGKEITWTTSNDSVATVANGIVTVATTASVGQTATITATLTNKPSASSSCVVTVVEQQKDKWTIMIYICGADLESQNGFATSDIAEILSVKRQPDDVNIIIETGGASSWKSTYGISSSKLGRWEVRNQKLNKISELNYSSMGLQSTFQSFLSWGLGTYPAEKTGVILWNHGGAMDGVCFDEKKNDDSLLNSEVAAACDAVLGSEKLEWIGYDACLMQVQDIAEFNSKHFNYMVAAEESEAGEGWDYDTWIDKVYSYQTTDTILKAICDGFVQSVTDLYVSEGYSAADNDQTLSYLDLSKMAAYKSAFDTLTNKVKSVGLSKLRTLMKNVKNYADMWVSRSEYSQYTSSYGYPTSWFSGPTDGYYLLHGYYLYGTFDVMDMLNKMKSSSNYSSCTTEITNAINALNELIVYSKIGQAAGNSNGLCVVVDMDGDNFVTESYKASETNFTAWRSFVTGN